MKFLCCFFFDIWNMLSRVTCFCIVNFFSAESAHTFLYNSLPSVLKISALNSFTYFYYIDENCGLDLGIFTVCTKHTRKRQAGTKRQCRIAYRYLLRLTYLIWKFVTDMPQLTPLITLSYRILTK